MSIRKLSVAFSKLETIQEVSGILKTASSKIQLEETCDASKIVRAEIKKHPNALFFRAKAIQANEVNQNGDYFSDKELERAFKTFEGVPFYTNHNNQDIENARGKIVWSEWNPSEKAIYVIGFVDREAYPHICRGIEEDYMRGVSMGALNGDAMILMDDLSEKRISEIKPGDKVISALGNTCNVKLIHNEVIGKDMYVFDLVSYHKSPMFTNDHPIYALREQCVKEEQHKAALAASKSKYKIKKGDSSERIRQDSWRTSIYTPEFIEASNISIGDYFLIPGKYKIIENDQIDPDWYYLAGAFLGDGFIGIDKAGNGDRIEFCLGANDVEFASKIVDIAKKFTDVDPYIRLVPERNGQYIAFYDKNLVSWFEKNIGTGCKQKRFKVKEIGLEQAKSLISGYIDADGCIAKSKKGQGIKGAQIGSVNKGLLEDVQSLGISLGLLSKLSKSERQPSGFVKTPYTEYTLLFGLNVIKEFEESLKISKVDQNPLIMAGKSFVTKINGINYMACPVKSVETVPFNESVFDITVEDDECYVADGVAVHNCQVEYSVCSICNNSAATIDEYCPHVKNLKGRKFSGKVKDVKTGEIKQLKDELVYEDNYGIRFIELSGVGDPAFRSCSIVGVFDNDKELQKTLQKAASVVNSIYLYKESGLYKNSSQQEIEQLNQALKSIEDICKNLISNRQNVEVEFASDLVKILADLQKFTDELVAAGYGQLQGGQVPGVDESQPLPASPTPEQDPMAPVQPVSETMEGEAIGTETGSPGMDMLDSPSLPSPPIKPMSETKATGLNKFSKDIGKLNAFSETIKEKMENQEMRRRIPGVVEKENEHIMRDLDNCWQEKQASLEYSERSEKEKMASRSEKTGEKVMPNVITEKQLEEDFRYHPRQKDERNEITESQLDQKGEEQNSIHEKQLEEKRTGYAPDQITQKQIETGGPRDPQSSRTDSEWNEIGQARLEEQRTGEEPNSITEKQLEDKTEHWKTIWSRASFQRKNTKTAKEHVKEVLNVLAKTSVNFGITPKQAQEVVSGMVDGVFAKNELLDAITKETSASKSKGFDVVARAKYYGKNGIKFASFSEEEIKEAFASSLNSLVQEDKRTHPEDVVFVLEAVAEDEKEGIRAISENIEKQIKMSESLKTQKVNKKKDFKEALSLTASREIETKEKKSKKIASKATHLIEASFDEVGIYKGMKKEAAKDKIIGFVKGVSIAQGMKLSGITNVNVDGKEIAIAVQWDEDGSEQEVNLSMDGDAQDTTPDFGIPEGDATGEGLDEMTSSPDDLSFDEGDEEKPLPSVASAKRKMSRTAQVPSGGAIPGMPGDMGSVPSEAPGLEEEGLQSLTEEPPAASKEEEEDIPSEKSLQNPPGSICPFCGSDDVDIGGKELADGACKCNNCGAIYSIAVNIEVLNPTELSFKEEEDLEEDELEAPKSPNLPSMPVAAQVFLNKKSIQKLSGLEQKFGNVCPACGTQGLKSLSVANSKKEYICPICDTKTQKQVLANRKDPKKGLLRVSWGLSHKKAIKDGCQTCKEAAKKFASKIKVAKMIKASQSSEFPMANCIERIARRHGVNAVSSYGPCKGKPLAECVCKELQQFAITSVRKMTKLSDAMMQEDCMDQCLKDQMEKGYTKEASAHICGTLKNLYASKADDNIYLLAWADEKDLTEEDLDEMNEVATSLDVEESLTDEDIGDPIREETAEDIGDPIQEETVTIELPENVADDIARQISQEEDIPEEISEIEIEDSIDEGDLDESVELDIEPPSRKMEVDDEAIIAKTKRKSMRRTSQIKQIDEVKLDSVPRSKKATMGNEGKNNIDVEVVELEFPTGDAAMGNEDESNIDVKVSLPKTPINTQYMGNEKEVQKDMPPISKDFRGRVLANIKSVKKIAKSPDFVEHVEIEVDSGIPRSDATMGNESESNINVRMGKPKIPRGNATMGNESRENIDVETVEVDVPVNSQYLGHEKETQSGMPEISLKEKGTVIANKGNHLGKIENARWKKAVAIAGRMLSSGSIEEDAFDDVAEVLSKVSLDKMEAYANKLFKKKEIVKNSSALTLPIVQEASGLELPEPEEASFSSLSDLFTIGSSSLDGRLKEFGMK